MLPARELAYKILLEVSNEGSFSNLILQEYLDEGVVLKEANLVRELVYGVLENQRYIDSIVSELSSINLEKIDLNILIILRIGIYQLLFLDRIPESAAVNESVNLAKIYSHKGSVGYVNGVLRKASREKNRFKIDNIKIKNENIGVSLSHPDYLVKLWEKQLGLDKTRDLLIANNSKPELNIRVNTLKTSINVLMDRLSSKGLKVRKGNIARDCLIVENPSGITKLDEFRIGLFTIQDESSMLLTEVANPKEGSLILDMCAAPGGKSTHIAQWINDRGKIISRDVSLEKIKLIDENTNRLGIKSIKTEIYNAQDLDETLVWKVDYVILDAPCSGFGLIRRKPDIKWSKSLDDVDSLISIQKKMLNIAAEYVKDNGILIYSTCTINNDENLNQIHEFLENNPRFKLQAFKINAKTIDDSQNLGYIQLLPSIHGTDGFFIAKLIKNNSIQR